MKTYLIISTLALALLAGCASNQQKTSDKPVAVENTAPTKVENPDLMIYPSLNDSLHRVLMMEGTKIVHMAMLNIKTALGKAIVEHSPEYAVLFCNVEALPLTDSLGRVMNVGLKRVAKKYRNPKNETKGIENQIYKEYVMGYVLKKTPRNRVDLNEEGHPVFYKLIDVKGECIMCHGTPNVDIPPYMIDQIKKLYPNDKAVDFKVGEPRGMWAVTFNNILIKTE